MCKGFPLKAHVFSEIEGEEVRVDKVPCELYCGFHQEFTSKLDERELLEDCKRCLRMKVQEALLVCGKCGRWYPVEEEIPRMMPDELRDKEEVAFLRKHEKEIPAKVLKEGLPFHL
jgi:uncharacterized protein YbaR (Trm112 family)